MNSYTTIFFPYGLYQPNKHKLQNLRTRFSINWNVKKVKENVPYIEIIDIYRLFKLESLIINDLNLRNRCGATGLWSNETNTLKIIVFNTTNENDYPPCLMIYRGEEKEFYKALVMMCINIGCLMGGLVEDEKGNLVQVFKRQLGAEEVHRLKDLEESKSSINEEFNARIEELKKMNCGLSDEFILLWKEMINKHGYYNIRNLLNEMSDKQENEGAT